MNTIFLTGGSGYLGRSLIPALVADGHQVRALARSEASAEIVTGLGATAATGDLSSVELLIAAISGCERVVHAAARMEQGGPPADYYADNVAGTRNLLLASRNAGVHRFVSIGAAMCLVGGQPILAADESWPLQQPRFSGYVASKTLSDQAVREANAPPFSTCVLRPGWIWGPADPHLETIITATRAGKMTFIDHGRHHLVTSHVDNVIHAIHLALRDTDSDRAYYIFDDDTLPIREFITRLLAARGLTAPTRSIPYPVARAIASTLETIWPLLHRPGPPPISRLLVELNGRPFTVTDHKARTELGYHPVISRDKAIQRLHTTTTDHTKPST